MSSDDQFIPCHFSQIEDGNRRQVECSAIERPDCFELFVDQKGQAPNMSGPATALRLPKSLFEFIADEGEPFSLRLLIPLDFDRIQLPLLAAIPSFSPAINRPMQAAPTASLSGEARMPSRATGRPEASARGGEETGPVISVRQCSPAA